MRIILTEKIPNLGALGEVVNVRPGFARNFLIPQGKARRATPEALRIFEGQRAQLEMQQADKLSAAQAVATRVNGRMVQITRRAGEDGRLFGSVTGFDVVEALKADGFDIPRAAIRMPNGPIKQVGDVKLEVDLHFDVLATVTVSVLGEH